MPKAKKSLPTRQTKTYRDLEKRYNNASTSLARMRKERKGNGGTMGAVKSSAAMLTGAAACGAARAFLGEELMGAPTDVVVGIGTVVLGAATKRPSIIHGGAGMLAGYVRDYTEDAVESARTTSVPATE